MIVETDYPSCVLDRDKIRLYRQSTTSMTRPIYVGEQRVIRVGHHICRILRVKLEKLNKVSVSIVMFCRVTKLLCSPAPCSTSVPSMTSSASTTSPLPLMEE